MLHSNTECINNVTYKLFDNIFFNLNRNQTQIFNMLLTKFLKKEKITQSQFSKKLGVNRVTVTHYCAGRRRPTSETMKKIIKITNGEVLPNDFYNI